MGVIKEQGKIEVKEYTMTGPVLRLTGDPTQSTSIKVYNKDRIAELNEAMFGKVNEILNLHLKEKDRIELMLCDNVFIYQLNKGFGKDYVAGIAYMKKHEIWVLCFDRNGDWNCIWLEQVNNEDDG